MRTYTPEERAHAIALALTMGDERAGAQLGINRRNISRWRAKQAPAIVAESQALRAQTAAQVADELWAVLIEGIAAVRAGLNDPKAKLGDKASALRIIVEAHRLVSGQSTQNIEMHSTVDEPPPVDYEAIRERDRLAEWLDSIVNASDEELTAALPTLLPDVANAERIGRRMAEEGLTDEQALELLAEGRAGHD